MKRIIILICAAMVFSLGGCSRKNQDLLTDVISADSELLTDALSKEDDQSADAATESRDSQSVDHKSTQDAGSDAATIFVYVCGCVANPAVYELKPDARIYEAINLAGGFLEEANPAALNLAENMVDGQKIYVPSLEEQEASTGSESFADTEATAVGQEDAPENRLVNLNTATKEQLMTLNGIGEAKANSIISYRENHGAFSAVEDIMKIEGIKEGVFNKIKDDITV